MSTREDNKSGSVVTTTTTTTTIEKSPDLALCELWTSAILGILLVIGSIASFNWPMIAVGLLSTLGSGILIFVQDNKQVRMVGFWILFLAFLLEALAFFGLVAAGVVLLYGNNFLGLGGFFGIIFVITSVPVLVMAVIDLMTILKVRPHIFEQSSVVINESVTSKIEKGDVAPSDSTDAVSASRAQKLPLLSFAK